MDTTFPEIMLRIIIPQPFSISAKHLSTNIPAEVLLQWNSPPPVPPLSDKSHPISMRQRKNMFDLREYDKYNETLNRSGLPSRHVRSAIVCVEPVKDPLYLSHSSRLSGIRQAKEVAHTRLENQRKKLYRKKRLVYKNSHETRQLKTQYSEKQRKRESRPLKLETNKKIKLVEVKVKKKVNSLTSDLSLIELLEHSREADQLLTVSSNVVKTSTPELNACHRDMVSIEDVHERPSLESKNQTLGIRNFSIRLVKIPFKFIT